MPEAAVLQRRKPKQSRSDTTRAAIVGAAAAVLGDRGFHAFSIRQVASEAGVSVGSIYEYFPSKQALLFWVVEKRLKERIAALDTVLVDTGSRSLHEVIDRFIQALREGGLYSRLDLEIRAAEEGDAKLAEYTTQHKDALTDRYVSLWRQYGSTATDAELRFIAEYAHQLDTLSMKLQLIDPTRKGEIRDINQRLIHLLADLAMQPLTGRKDRLRGDTHGRT